MMRSIMPDNLTSEDIYDLLVNLVRKRDALGNLEVHELSKPINERNYVGYSDVYVSVLKDAFAIMDREAAPSDVFDELLTLAIERCRVSKEYVLKVTSSGGDRSAAHRNHLANRSVLQKIRITFRNKLSQETMEKMRAVIYDPQLALA